MKIKYHDINILGLFVKYFEIQYLIIFTTSRNTYICKILFYTRNILKKIDIIDISLYQNVF